MQKTQISAQATTRLYAQYQDHTYARTKPVEIDSEQDGVDKAGSSPRFYTYEITTLEHNGKTYKGEQENASAWIYTNVEKVLTLDDVIAVFEADAAAAKASPALRDEFAKSIEVGAIESVIKNYRNTKSPDALFVPERGRSSEFIEIKPEDKAYNKAGQRVWPPADNPAPPAAEAVPGSDLG